MEYDDNMIKRRRRRSRRVTSPSKERIKTVQEKG